MYRTKAAAKRKGQVGQCICSSPVKFAPYTLTQSLEGSAKLIGRELPEKSTHIVAGVPAYPVFGTLFSARLGWPGSGQGDAAHWPT